MAKKPKAKALDTKPEPKRGNFIWEQHHDPKIRDAWRPILPEAEMGRLSPEGRGKIEDDRLNRAKQAMDDRDLAWIESLKRNKLEVIAEVLSSHVKTRFERESKGGKKNAEGSRDDKEAFLKTASDIGLPPQNTVAELLRHPLLKRYMGGYSESTLRSWIRPHDKRPKESRHGRPAKMRNTR